jgi:hypothetical protein
MLPYFDQKPLYDAFNVDLGAEGPNFFSGLFPSSTVVGNKIGLFQCPSDRTMTWGFSTSLSPGPLLVFSSITFTKGNYGVRWGNTQWGQQNITVNGRAINFMPSAFGHDGRVAYPSVTDGLSTTVFLAEILQRASTTSGGQSGQRHRAVART